MAFLNADEKEPTTDYSFVSAENVESFVSELKQPKQIFDAPEVEISEEEEDSDQAREDYKLPSANQQKMGNMTAKFVIKNADNLLAYVFAAIALNDRIEDYASDEEDIDELMEVWGFYFAQQGDFMSPVAMASITTLFIVLKKGKKSLADRKEFKKTRDYSLKLESLNSEKKSLDAEKELLKMQSEIEAIRKKVAAQKEENGNTES